MVMRPLHRVRHIGRYREIIKIFVKYGFGDVIRPLGIFERLSLRRDPENSRVQQSIQEQDAPTRARLALEELGPTFIKFGQLLSIRPDFIPPEYIAELEKLQDRASSLPWDVIHTTLEMELKGTIDESFQLVEQDPVGTASLAQVHAARLLDGSEVVLKIQRPDIEDQIKIDLEIMRDLASVIQTVTPLDRVYDLPGIVDDFATTLRQELDYLLEADNIAVFRENFAKEKSIYIPRVYKQFTTRRLLVMERLHGIKVDDIERLDAAGYDRHRLARAAAQLVVKEVLEDGFFHADPHPGNLYVMDDHVIGVMDFGMVGWVDAHLKKLIGQLYVAVVRGDTENMVNRLIQLHIAPADVDHLRLSRDLTRLLHKYRGRQLKHVRSNEVINDITVIAFQHQLRIPTELWLLLKTLGILEGVGLRLDPDFDFFTESKPFIARLARQRWSFDVIRDSMIHASATLNELITSTPELLRTIEQGQLKIVVELTGLDDLFIRIRRLVNHVTVTILLASIILGMSLLLSQIQDAPIWLILVLLGMFGTAVGLAFWLIWTMIRHR